MIRASRNFVLVTGATSRIGRLVVDELLRAGAPMRALTRTPERSALPDVVSVMQGDFTAPASLQPALDDVETVFLVWTAPLRTFAPWAADNAARFDAPENSQETHGR